MRRSRVINASLLYGSARSRTSTVTAGTSMSPQISVFASKSGWRVTWEVEGLRGFLRKLLASSGWSFAVCGVAALDSLLIGLEQHWRLERRDTEAFRLCETAFVAFYFCELLLVLYSFGKRSLSSRWVRLDSFLVLAGISSQLMLFTGMDEHLKKSVLLLRLARMMRLARTYRVLVKFRELWLLTHGFINSLTILFHTLILGMVILYVYGCVAMELIPLSFMESQEELSEELRLSLEHNFRSLPMAMLSLIQFATFDGANSIYRPWLEAMPSMALFFVSALFVLGVVFMNLVTAVIVNRALDNAMQDQDMQKATREKKRKALLHSLEAAFEEADANCSGELSREELASISTNQKALLAGIVGGSDLLKLFDYLDVDGDGAIGISEFCAGIEGLVQSDTRLEIRRMERMLESMRRQLRESMKAQCGIVRTMNSVSSVLNLPPDTFIEPVNTMPARCSDFGFTSTADSGRGCVEASRSVQPCPSFYAPSPTEAATEWTMPQWASDIIAGLRELGEKLDEAIGASGERSFNPNCVPNNSNRLYNEAADTDRLSREAAESGELDGPPEGKVRTSVTPEDPQVDEISTYDTESCEEEEHAADLTPGCHESVAVPWTAPPVPQSLPPVLLLAPPRDDCSTPARRLNL